MSEEIIKPNYKTNTEVVAELVDVIFEFLSKEHGASIMAIKPALAIAKMKISKMTDNESAEMVDKLHQISAYAEQQTGVFSRYHGV